MAVLVTGNKEFPRDEDAVALPNKKDDVKLQGWEASMDPIRKRLSSKPFNPRIKEPENSKLSYFVLCW